MTTAMWAVRGTTRKRATASRHASEVRRSRDIGAFAKRRRPQPMRKETRTAAALEVALAAPLLHPIPISQSRSVSILCRRLSYCPRLPRTFSRAFFFRRYISSGEGLRSKKSCPPLGTRNFSPKNPYFSG